MEGESNGTGAIALDESLYLVSWTASLWVFGAWGACGRALLCL